MDKISDSGSEDGSSILPKGTNNEKQYNKIYPLYTNGCNNVFSIGSKTIFYF